MFDLCHLILSHCKKGLWCLYPSFSSLFLFLLLNKHVTEDQTWNRCFISSPVCGLLRTSQFAPPATWAVNSNIFCSTAGLCQTKACCLQCWTASPCVHSWPVLILAWTATPGLWIQSVPGFSSHLTFYHVPWLDMQSKYPVQHDCFWLSEQKFTHLITVWPTQSDRIWCLCLW